MNLIYKSFLLEQQNQIGMHGLMPAQALHVYIQPVAMYKFSKQSRQDVAAIKVLDWFFFYSGVLYNQVNQFWVLMKSCSYILIRCILWSIIFT